MRERTEIEFVKSLKVGDKVAVFEGYTDDDALSEVVSITAKYIQIERYPSLRFDRQTGKQVSKKRHYRYLYCPEELQIQKDHDSYKEKLVKLLDFSTITEERYEQCRTALEQILKD